MNHTKSPPPPTGDTLTMTDLRFHLRFILDEVQAGRSFKIQRYRKTIAVLKPEEEKENLCSPTNTSD